MVDKLAQFLKKYSDKEEKYTIEIKNINDQTMETVLRVLKTATSIGNVGHSYSIAFDIDKRERNGETPPEVDWDGDGSCRFDMDECVFVNGESYKNFYKE